MRRFLGTVVLFGLCVALFATLVFAQDAVRPTSNDYIPLPGKGTVATWAGPLLVCWQAERLIAALQPGVEGLPEHCTTLDAPITFMVNSEYIWATTLQWDGGPLLVGVYEIVIAGRPGLFYTVLTARPRPRE